MRESERASERERDRQTETPFTQTDDQKERLRDNEVKRRRETEKAALIVLDKRHNGYKE